MPRYVAFLRGVSPLNAKMPELKHCFEAVGLENVRTLLSSGNVAFDSKSKSSSSLVQKCEKAMQTQLGRTFSTFVRPSLYLQKLIEGNPFAEFALATDAKPIVTFLPEIMKSLPCLPIEFEGARVLKVVGQEVLAAYLPNPKGPAFMALLERTFGKNITTRTLATVEKCAYA